MPPADRPPTATSAPRDPDHERRVSFRAARRRRFRPSFTNRAGNWLLLTAGALVGALGFVLFLAPGNVAPGGVMGLTLVVSRYLPIGVPEGTLLLLLNVPLLYLGYRRLGGGAFVVRTVYVVLLMGVAIDLLPAVLPIEGISDDPLLNAIYGGAMTGAASALAIRGYGNIGGTAILARVFQKRSGMPIGQIYLLIDGSIVLLLGFAFGWERALYSLIALFLTGFVTDYGVEGPSVVRTVFIVTDHPRDVSLALQMRLNTGVTAWKGEGMYEGGERNVLFCTVNRSEERELLRVVREVDAHAFVVIGQGQTASGGTLGKSDRVG